MITIQDLKDFAESSNLKSLASKMKESHWSYAEHLLNKMKNDSEAEMNRVWCSLPRAEKPNPEDKLARLVPELIVRVIGQRKRGAE